MPTVLQTVEYERSPAERSPTHQFNGSTLRAISTIEVLIVMSVMMFLLAMLFPGLSTLRERARRVMCKNNLRSWSTAFHAYRHDHNDYLPKEGSSNSKADGAWYNELPYYLDLPPYKDLERLDGNKLKELPDLHVWICPSKNATSHYASGSGKSQFHYGMNQVLDGLRSVYEPSRDAPDFPDQGSKHQPTHLWSSKPHTVLMFDIYPNSPAGTPRDVSTSYQGVTGRAGKFRLHGDYANILYINGSVGNCTTDDLVTDRDFKHGDVIWNNPKLYWGYTPKPPKGLSTP